ncbi:MAG: Gfo/Idh/MocA family oxidoreductase [Acidimicrobiia bacterium]
MSPVRFGILGAARIAPTALVRPARAVDDAEVVAVAARDPERARKFAAKHSIPRVHASYDELVADPGIDAIYNPLPNGLHGEWTVNAVEAGKHVLCEKPFTANEAEAREVAAVADASDRVVMEAFHYRYHPLAQRMHDIVTGGDLGEIRRVETNMCIPLPMKSDIRYQYDLAGGATMDVGCYALHMARLLGGEPDVTAARARLMSPNVDRWMQADLAFPGGATGQMTCALWSSTPLKISIRVVGSAGSMRVFNPTGPHYHHRLTVKTADGTRREKLGRTPTYTYQLGAFCNAVLHGGPVLTPPSDSIVNMRVIDEVYRKAGLTPRGT